MAVIATGGYLNRWNDTIATVTDQESIDFATVSYSLLAGMLANMLVKKANSAKPINKSRLVK